MKAVLFGLILGAIAVVAAGEASSTEIRSKGDKCMDIPNGNTKPGTKVHYWPCDGSPEQQWVIQGGRIRGKDGMCLDVPDGDTRDGTRIHIWQCDGSPEQRWQLADGEIRIGGKCLDLPNGATKDGTPIQLWPCDGSPEQKWRYQAAAASAPPSPANLLGRVMALMLYIEKCRIPATNAQVQELTTTGARLQRAAGIPESQMNAVGDEVAKNATSPCETVRTIFDQSYRETIASASSIP